MKVSIIVPVYNAENFLSRCIESLINQSYTDIEILLINDGSTDRSLKICEEYQKKYDFVTCYTKSNEGLGLTRNFGINKATGDFMVFIDSDDLITSNFIELLLSAQSENDYDLVVSGHSRINLQDEVISSKAYDDSLFIGDEVQEKLLPMLIGSSPNGHDSISVSACGVLYKSSIIKNNNLFFKSEREYISEDLLFNIEYMNCCNTIKLLSICGYLYRLNTNSLTTSYRMDRFEKTKFIYETEKKLLINLNIYEKCKYRLSKQFFIYLRMCISQENIEISGKSRRHALKQISNICSDDLVRCLIKDYPVQKLGFQQQVYIRLIQLKQSWLLYLFVILKII